MQELEEVAGPLVPQHHPVASPQQPWPAARSPTPLVPTPQPVSKQAGFAGIDAAAEIS